LELKDIDKIIQDMGGAEKLEKFLPLPLDQLEPYIKAGTLDKMIPGNFWIAKLGFYGNGVSTFYRRRTDPPFPKELNIKEQIEIAKRVAVLLLEKRDAKRVKNNRKRPLI
jgi:hypothetical protein